MRKAITVWRCRLKLSLAAVCLALAQTLAGAEIHLFAAASLSESLTEIGQLYQAESTDKVILNLAASSTLARQIEAGAPADIFFSADERNMDRLSKSGRVIPETRRDLLSNSLVLVVAARGGPEIQSVSDLARPGIRRVALGDPEVVPIGLYARQYLEKQGIWEAVKKKIVPMENVRAALAAVESGDADASIVYKTDALISRKVKVVLEVPLAEGPPISYPIALVKGATAAEPARKFLMFLCTEEAGRIFQKHGFVWSGGSSRK
jgi:molybdate transport system substrate-binding protein